MGREWVHLPAVVDCPVEDGVQVTGRAVIATPGGRRVVAGSMDGLISAAIDAARSGRAHLWLPDLARVGQHLVAEMLVSGLPRVDGPGTGPRWRVWAGRTGSVMGLSVWTDAGEVMITGMDTAGLMTIPPLGYPMEGMLSRVEDSLSGVLERRWTMMSIAGTAGIQLRRRVGDAEERWPSICAHDYRWLYEAYRPGLCYARPGLYEMPCVVADVSGAYPYILSSQPLPVGEPIRGCGCPPPEGGFWIADVTVDYESRRIAPPMVVELGDSGTWDEPHRAGRARTLRVSSVEWETLCATHDITVLSWGAWMWWRTDLMPNAGRRLIHGWYRCRRRDEADGLGAASKRRLNSLQGSYGRPPVMSAVAPRLDALGIVRWDEHRLSEPRPASYLPVAIAVVALQRDRLVRMLARYGRRVVYSDTDSIVVTGDNLDMGLDGLGAGSGLGRWRVQARPSQVRVWGPKMWARIERGRAVWHVASMPSSAAPSEVDALTDEGIGEIHWGQECRTPVPGGVECGYVPMRFTPAGTSSIMKVTGLEGSVLDQL